MTPPLSRATTRHTHSDRNRTTASARNVSGTTIELSRMGCRRHRPRTRRGANASTPTTVNTSSAIPPTSGPRARYAATTAASVENVASPARGNHGRSAQDISASLAAHDDDGAERNDHRKTKQTKAT
jgi:hypothetical protein